MHISNRPRDCRPIASSAALTAMRPTAPGAPVGQGSAAPGKEPQCSATQTNQQQGQPASWANTTAGASQMTEHSAASNPTTVVTATTGSASTLAKIATTLS